MSSHKMGFEESLRKNVIAAGRCLGCGACVVVCPFHCLEYQDGKPKLVEECQVCGICPQVCPQYDWSWSKVENFVFGRERKREEKFGIYRRLVKARAEEDKILEAGQDGGVVTALLTFALQKGIIDNAVVSGFTPQKPLYPAPKLATTTPQIIECAGTRYCYSPNILALAEAAIQKNVETAFVGTPCQIRALRKIQMFGLKKYTKPLQFLIGLMCSECFTYQGLMEEYIHQKLGLDLRDIEKMNIKGKILVKTESGIKTIPLAEAKSYSRESCNYCDDFSSELADISAGGLGLEGWTFIIIRTENGEEIFSKAVKAGVIHTKPVEKEDFPYRLLLKLSKKKRKSADK